MFFTLFPFASILVLVSAADNPYTAYPSVAKTASINGFADRIYGDLPECAQPCVKSPTASTPCPYWDTGCLCVMNTWGSDVAGCIAEKCAGSDVSVATSLAISACSAAGVWEPYWIINSSASSALAAAAEAKATTEDETTSTLPATSTDITTSSDATTTSEPTTTTSEEEPSEKSTSEEQTSEKSTSEVAISSSEAATSEAAESTSEAASVSEEAESTSASVSASVSINSTYDGGAGVAGVAGMAGIAAGFMMLL